MYNLLIVTNQQRIITQLDTYTERLNSTAHIFVYGLFLGSCFHRKPPKPPINTKLQATCPPPNIRQTQSMCKHSEDIFSGADIKYNRAKCI